jgi:hypothetical protein
MSFHPWRHEKKEVGATPEDKYQQHLVTITGKYMEYDAFARTGIIIEEILEEEPVADDDTIETTQILSEVILQLCHAIDFLFPFLLKIHCIGNY